jgi:hypothetical protein
MVEELMAQIVSGHVFAALQLWNVVEWQLNRRVTKLFVDSVAELTILSRSPFSRAQGY